MDGTRSSTNSRAPSPIRRIRQACINCRRKKSKCPGEKPQCSTCRRLEQVCTYEASGGDVVGPTQGQQTRKRVRIDEGRVEGEAIAPDEVVRRFGSIEEKLSQLAAHVQKVVPGSNSGQQTGSVRAEETVKPPRQGEDAGEQQSTVGVQLVDMGDSLPLEIIEDGIRTYFSCFHAQPYSLLSKASCQLPNLKPVILNPMLALSIRCSSHVYWSDRYTVQKWTQILSERSWRELMQMYSAGETGLLYLQGLCLLAQVDFSDGRVHRAHTQLSLGIRIAQFSGYLAEKTGPDTEKSEDIIRCAWTLFMLDRTYSITQLVSPTLTHHHFRLRKPISEKELSLRYGDSSNDGVNEQDLSALLVGVYSIWDDAIRYVFQTTSKSTTPPWQPGSELATIEYRFVDFEPDFSTHRYRLVGFPQRAINEPHLRLYYATWLCFQLTYMSIQCCIHHPFIMFIKLRHVIRNVPPSFLQKSYKSSLIHSRWIIRFLDEMDEAGMMLYDPFIGYLAAIAATCQLEHTLSKHPDIAASARLSFRSAVRFLRRLAGYWRNVGELLHIVEELAARLSKRHTLYYSQDDYDGILPAVETERVGLAADDMSLMWKLFDFAAMSASASARDNSVNGVDGARRDGVDRMRTATNMSASHILQEAAETHRRRSPSTPRTRRSFIPSAAGQLINTLSSNPQTQTQTQLTNSFPAIHNNIMSNTHTVTGQGHNFTPAAIQPEYHHQQQHQQQINTPDEDTDALNLALFDQLPEDWVFTIDDWTLFGAPGSTYFYNEGG